MGVGGGAVKGGRGRVAAIAALAGTGDLSTSVSSEICWKKSSSSGSKQARRRVVVVCAGLSATAVEVGRVKEIILQSATNRNMHVCMEFTLQR